jgi:hypothetical protein
VFQMYVAMVIRVCCKGLFPMFHLYFQTYCCKWVYRDVAYVSRIRCEYFIWILCMFAIVFKCFSVVFANISEACLKCFICLLLYVASVASRRFKNRSDECRVSADQISSGVSRLHDG